MKNYLLTLIFMSSIFAGVMEYYGSGERILNYDSSGIGLGDVYHFGGSLTDVLDNSPSTLWKSPLTRINLATNYVFSKTEFKRQDIAVSHFSFSFPFSNQKVFSFGLNPYTRTNYLLHEEDGYFIAPNQSSSNINPMQIITDYRSHGGISNGYGALSLFINKYISFGVKYAQMFGTQVLDKKILQNEIDPYTDAIIDQDSTQQIIINEYKGNSIQIDSRINFRKNEVVFSATFSSQMEVKSSLYYDVYSYPDIYDRYFLNDFSFVFVESADQLMQTNPNQEFNQSNKPVKFLDGLRDFSFGYQYLIKPYSGLIFEYHNNNNYDILKSFNYINQLNIANYPVLESYHLGYFYRIDDAKGSLLSNIIFRSGLYHRYLNFDSYTKKDIGITLGLGLGLINNSYAINLAFKMGKIDTDLMGLSDENYFKFTLGLNLGEKWFVKN